MSRAPAVTFEGFVHAEGGSLVDGRGQPLLMRGVGLGGWLLPEGYMWRFPREAPQSPREIEAFVEGLIGVDAAVRFWRGYREHFVAEQDIERIARDGFDHVRLPMNARLLVDGSGDVRAEGLEPIDRLIDWCREYGLWVVLDLHGAPGGQTGTNIDDSPRGQPDLFILGGSYREQAIRLWTQLAERYRDETVIAGYDLLNEPLPNEFGERYASDLVHLYRDLTTAIREVDPNHLLIYEGTRWATDWSIFTEVWDRNSMLQFHRYWIAPDRASVAAYLEKGRALGLPVYMGEGGENDLAWLQTAFGLYEDLGISWNFWPWKKMATWNSPVSIVPPEGWAGIVEAAAGHGLSPSRAEAQRVLDDLLEHIRFDACVERPDVVNALFHRVPIKLAAASFGFGGDGRSYRTERSEPLEWFRADDNVTIRSAQGTNAEDAFGPIDAADPRPCSLDVVIAIDDWVEYTFEVTEPLRLAVTLDPCPERHETSRLPDVTLDGVVLPEHPDGEWVRWQTTDVVREGRHALRVVARAPETVIRFVSIGPAAA